MTKEFESNSYASNHSDNSSRRAFPLDSRARWVESSIDRYGSVYQIDNLPNGPMEYTPKLQSKHISTPFLATPTHFKQFVSGINRPDLSDYGKQQKQQQYTDAIYDRNEMITPFHLNKGERNPYDSKLRTTKTPGFYSISDNVLNSISSNGKSITRKVVLGPDNIPFGERGEDTKLALPDYCPNYDSKYVRKTVTNSKISTSERFPEYSNSRKYKSDAAVSSSALSNNQYTIAVSPIKGSSNILHNRDASTASVNHSSSIVKPKMKLRTWDKLIFDSSCYDNTVLAEPLTLTPSVINKAINLDPFASMLKVNKSYNSRSIASKVSQRVKMYT